MNLAVLAQRNVERFGGYGSLVFGHREHTNVEQLDAANRFAGALVRVGLAPGDRVGVMMPNFPEVFQVVDLKGGASGDRQDPQEGSARSARTGVSACGGTALQPSDPMVDNVISVAGSVMMDAP